MANFDDPDYAARFRDAVRQAVAEEVNKLRPAGRYGTVSVIDGVNRNCFVLFPGEEEPVPVSIGSIVPAWPGQVVRVMGKAGDKYVDDVIGTAGGMWRSFTPDLADNWATGDGGYVKLTYNLQGRTCHVNWEVLFLGTGLADGSGDYFKIKMPLMHEAGPVAIGPAYGRHGAAGEREVFAGMMTGNDDWLQLVSASAPDGVKAGTPWWIGGYTTFAGSLTYQVSAFHLALLVYLGYDLPGVPL